MKKFNDWKDDYQNNCYCSEDDRCGCAFPDDAYERARAKQYTVPVKVGEQAINFTAPAVLGDGSTTDAFNLFDYISGSYALLVFYLADFSAVCPLELTAFNQAYEEFRTRDIKMVAISVDSLPAHLAWRRMPFSEGGIGNVQFPLVSDVNKTACRAYGVLRPDGLAQRAIFLIDKNYTIRYQSIFDRRIARDVEETLRIVDEQIRLDETECKGMACWGKKISSIYSDEKHT